MSQNPHTAFPLVRTLGAVAVLLGLVACAAPSFAADPKAAWWKSSNAPSNP